jgi:hypothetical protein
LETRIKKMVAAAKKNESISVEVGINDWNQEGERIN